MKSVALDLSTGAVNMIAALLEQRTGQQISADRAWRIETALTAVMRSEQLGTLDALVGALVGARDAALAERVVDALLNQETSFFRDTGVLDGAVEALRAMQADAPGRRLRIWSAGCATGQEPLSLAMLLADDPAFAGNLPEIVATDVSPSALARAKQARYSQFEVQRGLPVRRMIAWFEGEGGEWTANRALVRRIQFRQHNLTADPPPPGKFDLLLCRNVLLYFSLPLRRRVFETLAEGARPGALLLLGAGETVIGQTDAFRPSKRHRGLYRAVAPHEAQLSAMR